MEFIASNMIIVIISAVILIAIIIIFIRRIQLKLWFSRSHYGKYSYKYVSLFKKYFDKNPYPHAVKYEVIPFLQVLNKTNLEESITDKNIVFQDLEPGKPYIDLFKLKGEPDCFTIQEFKKTKIFVWGYDNNMYDYYTTVLYFFIDDIFIMGQYNFSRENQNIVTNDLFNKLKDKYFENGERTDQKEIIIKDSKGTKIQLFDDGFSFRICLYNPDVPIVKEKLLKKTNNKKQPDINLMNDQETDTLIF